MAINIDNRHSSYSSTSPISIISSSIVIPSPSPSAVTTSTHKKKRKQSISSSLLIKSSKSLKQSISIGSIKSDLYNQRLNTYKNHPLINDHQQEKYYYEEELDDNTSFEDDEEEDDEDDVDVDDTNFSYSDDYSLSSYSTAKHTTLSKSPSIQSSLSSSSNYSTSLNLNNIYASTITTTVSPSYINTTSQVMKSLPSTDSLTKLLQESQPRTIPLDTNKSIEFLTDNSRNTNNKSVVFSNLTRSIKKNWKLLKNNPIFFIKESPRLTDDILPIDSDKTSSSTTTSNHTSNQQSQELITFSKKQSTQHENDHDHDLIRVPSNKSFKNRDHRINATFLRLYAMDYNARAITKTLLNQPLSMSTHNELSIFETDEEEEDHESLPANLIQFHQKYNLYRISNLSRDKLWKSVILAPRLDSSPLNHINCDDYIYIGNEEIQAELNDQSQQHDGEPSVISSSYSLIRKQGNYLPWTTTAKNHGILTRSIKPAGILNNSSKLNHGLSPTSGFTKAQFTVKGWCNPRWIDCSNDN